MTQADGNRTPTESPEGGLDRVRPPLAALHPDEPESAMLLAFDAVYLTATSESVPDLLVEQTHLRVTVVAPVGVWNQHPVRLRKREDGIERRVLGPAFAAVALLDADVVAEALAGAKSQVWTTSSPSECSVISIRSSSTSRMGSPKQRIPTRAWSSSRQRPADGQPINDIHTYFPPRPVCILSITPAVVTGPSVRLSKTPRKIRVLYSARLLKPIINR